MNEKRREIIIREIEYWKRSRLLPKQYCDYLLALYTEGLASNRSHISRFNLIHLLFISMICLLFPISILVIYFTELSFVLQMLLLFLFFIVCMVAVWLWAKERKLIHLPLISGAFLLLLASVQACDYYFPKEKAIVAVVIFLNCLLWMVIGIRFRFFYFTISGIAGLGLLCASLFF
ncbi:hypothetical protein [Thermaerobacillus caldiproteolyticus]|uniref:hypothetical protein n=1 Tax=Thermaerobacillus caldiproteolyticus TaxID=247480 RepID=UPI00188A42A9|nr:hypothetical protein [Anoxybacillus caldiproteolyticus]QPA30105.1 hypothetical protein ISX45_10615 [Anoxybacillus caldiproteolyticus]